MIKKCKISGNDFVSTNGEDICSEYYKAYKLGYEDGKKSVENKSETETLENLQTEIVNQTQEK